MDDSTDASGEYRTQVRLGRLENALGYHLRMAQEAAFRAYIARVGDPTLKPKRYALLQLIGDNPGLSQTDLGHAVRRDKSSITPALQDLISHGLVKRRLLPRDKRIRLLTLTAKGREVLAKLRQRAEEHDRMLSAAMTAQERDTLLRLLGAITAASVAYVRSTEPANGENGENGF